MRQLCRTIGYYLSPQNYVLEKHFGGNRPGFFRAWVRDFFVALVCAAFGHREGWSIDFIDRNGTGNGVPVCDRCGEYLGMSR